MSIKQFIIILFVILITGCGMFKSADDLYLEAEAKRNTGNSKVSPVVLSVSV